jgi:hypothetical protein
MNKLFKNTLLGRGLMESIKRHITGSRTRGIESLFERRHQWWSLEEAGRRRDCKL